MSKRDEVLELLPCPFCGEDGADLLVTETKAGGEGWWQVYCDNCASYGPPNPTEAEAIAAWYHRSPTPLAARVETLREVSERATAGEWMLYGSDALPEKYDICNDSQHIAGCEEPDDAHLIVAAVNLIRATLNPTDEGGK